jgi:hypothetical protein
VNFTRFVASCSIAWLPLVIACASSSETDLATPKDAGKDVAKDAPTDASGSGGTDAGLEAAAGGSGGSGGSGGGSCNVDFCPTPAPPATKCCVTANGPCGVDYGQGQGCSSPGSGGSGP